LEYAPIARRSTATSIIRFHQPVIFSSKEACIEMIAALKVAEKEEKAIVLWPNVKEEGGEK